MLIALTSFLGCNRSRISLRLLLLPTCVRMRSISIEPARLRFAENTVAAFSPRRRLAFSANIVHRIRIYMNSFF
jgi:hypothetical protein